MDETIAARRRHRLALALLLTGLAGAASASGDCWAPNREDGSGAEGLPARHARLAAMNARLDGIETQLRGNAAFNALPQLRLRIFRYVSRGQPRAAHIVAQGWEQSTWSEQGCGIRPAAEAIGPAALISFNINNPTDAMHELIGDDRLQTYGQPEREGEVAGWPVYAGCTLLSAGHRLPWVAVTRAEYIDLLIRRLQRRLAEFERAQARPVGVDTARIERLAAQMRKTDPAAAEQLLATARAMQQSMNESRAQAAADDGAGALKADIAALQQRRQNLSASARQAQAHQGSDRFGLPGPGEDLDKLPALVKRNPDYVRAGGADSRINSLFICSGPHNNPVYTPVLQDALRELDWNYLAGLLAD